MSVLIVLIASAVRCWTCRTCRPLSFGVAVALPPALSALRTSALGRIFPVRTLSKAPRGDPRDSDKAVPLAKRATKALGHAPEQICFDGGFSARANIGEIKSLGIRDVVFSKAPGIAIKERIKRTWLYQRLRHFRAGIEGIISFLKRSFGWDRCAWRSYGSFRAYAWSSVIAANLVMLARHALG